MPLVEWLAPSFQFWSQEGDAGKVEKGLLLGTPGMLVSDAQEPPVGPALHTAHSQLSVQRIGRPLKPLCFSALLGYTSSSSPIFPFVPGNGDHFSQDWEFLCRLQQRSQGYTEVSPRHVRGPEGFWMECVKISTCKQNRMCGETSTITNCRFRPAHVYLRTSHARGVCCDCDCVGDVTDSQSEDENTTDKDLASSVT